MLFWFEDYALDTDRRELRRGAAPLSIEPQVFDLLEFLVRNRDRVVSKDDLLASVWGGRIVSESTLFSRINAARRAIGDSGDRQRLIRTITDSVDADFGVDEWHGHNVFFRDGERVFRTYFINNRGDEAMGTTWSYLDITPLGRQETWEDSPEGYPQTPPYKWWNWHDNYDPGASPDAKWVDIVTDPYRAAARRRDAEAKTS